MAPTQQGREPGVLFAFVGQDEVSAVTKVRGQRVRDKAACWREPYKQTLSGDPPGFGFCDLIAGWVGRKERLTSLLSKQKEGNSGSKTLFISS